MTMAVVESSRIEVVLVPRVGSYVLLCLALSLAGCAPQPPRIGRDGEPPVESGGESGGASESGSPSLVGQAAGDTVLSAGGDMGDVRLSWDAGTFLDGTQLTAKAATAEITPPASASLIAAVRIESTAQPMQPVRVTLTVPQRAQDGATVFLHSPDGAAWNPLLVVGADPNQRTVTVVARSFSILGIFNSLLLDGPVDTGFRDFDTPVSDNVDTPRHPTYTCLGMACFTGWYYENGKSADIGALCQMSRLAFTGNPPPGSAASDDSIAGRSQDAVDWIRIGLSQFFESAETAGTGGTELMEYQRTQLLWVLHTTKRPQVLGVTTNANPWDIDHALLVTGCDAEDTFKVYNPNYPHSICVLKWPAPTQQSTPPPPEFKVRDPSYPHDTWAQKSAALSQQLTQDPSETYYWPVFVPQNHWDFGHAEDTEFLAALAECKKPNLPPTVNPPAPIIMQPGDVKKVNLGALGTASVIEPDGDLWDVGWDTVPPGISLRSDLPFIEVTLAPDAPPNSYTIPLKVSDNYRNPSLTPYRYTVSCELTISVPSAPGSIVAWGPSGEGQGTVPAPNTGFVAIAGGQYHSLGLRADGSIVAWVYDNNTGQCNVPAPNTGFAAVAGGRYHSLGLKVDGSIVGWGDNGFGQCNVPAPKTGFVAVAGGGYHSLGLKADGSIVAWGWNDSG